MYCSAVAAVPEAAACEPPEGTAGQLRLPRPPARVRHAAMAPLAAVVPEEVALCALIHLFVHPPPVASSAGRPLSAAAVAHKLAPLLLREVRVRHARREGPGSAPIYKMQAPLP